jgi:hypothetical protein
MKPRPGCADGRNTDSEKKTRTTFSDSFGFSHQENGGEQ